MLPVDGCLLLGFSPDERVELFAAILTDQLDILVVAEELDVAPADAIAAVCVALVVVVALRSLPAE